LLTWNSRPSRWTSPSRETILSTATACPLHEVLKLLTAEENPDTLALSRRVADHISGQPEPMWQYIAVSIRPAYPVALHAGWQLAPVDGANDALLPLGYPDGYLAPFTPEAFHLEHGYGAIRRVSGETDVLGEGSARENRELTPLMLLLNLATDHPVHASFVYYIDPGTGRTLPPELRSEASDRHFHPKELHRWEHINGYWVPPRRGRVLSAAETEYLSRFARELGALIQRLDGKRQARLLRAADQHLIVAHRTPGSNTEIPAVPSMHEPEAAFRWVSALEGLLTSEDGDHSDLGRKTAQRAAVLVGEDDEDRLSIRNLVKSAYAVRSAYAYGGGDKAIDLAALRTLARKIVISWIVLAAEVQRGDLSDLLDDALLSSARLSEVQRLVRHFRERL
jgi:hypothetical protein